MKYLPLLFLIIGFLHSCTENKTTELTSKELSKEKGEVYKDPRTKAERERDSIRFINSVTILKVVKKSPLIDPKKLKFAPFNTINFDKAVAYSFDGSQEQIKIAPGIGETRASSSTIDQQVGLNQEQANAILSLFAKKNTYDMKQMGCFEPRFAIVLYKGTSSVMQISVCLDCNNVHFTPEIKVNNESGLSQKARKSIIAFCKELKFPYGELKESITN